MTFVLRHLSKHKCITQVIIYCLNLDLTLIGFPEQSNSFLWGRAFAIDRRLEPRQIKANQRAQ
jgi:hypothetical protein